MSKEFEEWAKLQNVEMTQSGNITRINGRDLRNDIELAKIAFAAGQQAGSAEYRWIPVTERMPEGGELPIHTGFYHGKKRRVFMVNVVIQVQSIQIPCCDVWDIDSKEFVYNGNIIAWQPLPETHK